MYDFLVDNMRQRKFKRNVVNRSSLVAVVSSDYPMNQKKNFLTVQES